MSESVTRLDLSRQRLYVFPGDALPEFHPTPRRILITPMYDNHQNPDRRDLNQFLPSTNHSSRDDPPSPLDPSSEHHQASHHDPYYPPTRDQRYDSNPESYQTSSSRRHDDPHHPPIRDQRYDSNPSNPERYQTSSSRRHDDPHYPPIRDQPSNPEHYQTSSSRRHDDPYPPIRDQRYDSNPSNPEHNHDPYYPPIRDQRYDSNPEHNRDPYYPPIRDQRYDSDPVYPPEHSRDPHSHSYSQDHDRGPSGLSDDGGPPDDYDSSDYDRSSDYDPSEYDDSSDYDRPSSRHDRSHPHHRKRSLSQPHHSSKNHQSERPTHSSSRHDRSHPHHRKRSLSQPHQSSKHHQSERPTHSSSRHDHSLPRHHKPSSSQPRRSSKHHKSDRKPTHTANIASKMEKYFERNKRAAKIDPFRHLRKCSESMQRVLKEIPPSPHFRWSECTGNRKAVCIGINYTGQKDALKGCSNDARHMRSFLMKDHGFQSDNILLLTDDGQAATMEPTRSNMFDAMSWLVKDAKQHDSLFFHYSGHGGQMDDKTGTESDGKDEVIFPADFKSTKCILDNDLFTALVSPLPTGCRLTAVFDSCHSGTILDLPYLHSAHGRLRSLVHITQRARKRSVAPKADVICFAACKDDETSADTFQGGVAVGAMSYALLKILKGDTEQNKHETYEDILQQLRDILIPKYRQKAQLSGTHPVDLNREFTL